MEHDILIEFRKTVKQFDDIPEEGIDTTAKLHKKYIYKKNEYFSTIEEPSQLMAFVAKGLFRMFFINRKGKEITFGFFGENTFMSSYAGIFLAHYPPCYIQALEDSIIYAIPRTDCIKVWEDKPNMKNVIQKITEHNFVLSRKREYGLMLYDAKTRYLNFMNDYPHYADRVKIQYLASFLGVSRETLSRIRSAPL